MIKENIKLITKIASKSFLKLLFIVFLGTTISVLFLIIILFQNSNLSGGGHGNSFGFILNLFLNNIFAFVLLVGFPFFVFLYFMIANKIAIQQFIHLIYTNKAGDILESKVINIVDKLTSKNDWTNKIYNESTLRIKLIEANKKNQDSSKIKKRAINYLLKKIKLDDIDFSNKDLKLSEVISSKLNNFVSKKIKPSLLFFWMLFLFQIILFICAQFRS